MALLKLRAIADHAVTHADQHQGCLLLGRFHRDEAHYRPAHRLAQRFSIRRIVLAALDVRFDQLRRDQLHCMAERLQQSCPVITRTARFDPDHSSGRASRKMSPSPCAEASCAEPAPRQR